MALGSLKSRIERLEVKHKVDAEKVVGVIDLRFHPTIEIVDGVAYQRPAITPDEFSAFAWQQQSELRRELIAIMGNDAPQTERAPQSVGTLGCLPFLVAQDAPAATFAAPEKGAGHKLDERAAHMVRLSGASIFDPLRGFPACHVVRVVEAQTLRQAAAARGH